MALVISMFFDFFLLEKLLFRLLRFWIEFCF